MEIIFKSSQNVYSGVSENMVVLVSFFKSSTIHTQFVLPTKNDFLMYLAFNVISSNFSGHLMTQSGWWSRIIFLLDSQFAYYFNLFFSPASISSTTTTLVSGRFIVFFEFSSFWSLIPWIILKIFYGNITDIFFLAAGTTHHRKIFLLCYGMKCLHSIYL